MLAADDGHEKVADLLLNAGAIVKEKYELNA